MKVENIQNKFNRGFSGLNSSAKKYCGSVSFGANLLKITSADFKGIKDVLNKGYNSLFDILQSKAGDLSKVIKEDGGDFVLAGEGRKEKFVRCVLYPFIKMPKDVYDSTIGWFASRFPKNKTFLKLNNFDFIKNYRSKKAADEAVRTLKGAIEGVSSKIKANPGANIKEIISKIDMDDVAVAFDPKTGKYKTTTERSLNRLVTALIPAVFYGNDVYNLSKRNGATDAEANKTANQRMVQEAVRAGGESYTTYSTLNLFDKITNTNQMAAPVINTISKVAAEAGSRAVVGKSLLPLKPVDNKTQSSTSKNSDNIQTDNNKISTASQEEGSTKKEKKKHLLSIKNVLIFCAASILGGFSLKALNKYFSKFVKEKPDKWLSKTFSSIKDKLLKLTKEDLIVSKDELKSYYSKIENSGFGKLAGRFRGLVETNAEEINGKIKLGEVDKLVKIPLFKQKVPVAELLKIPLLPFKILYRIASMPYRSAKKALQGAAASKLFKDKNWAKNVQEFLETKKPDDSTLKPIFNAYYDYTLRAKNLNAEEFKKYFENTITRTFNPGYSKVDNSKMGKASVALITCATLPLLILDDYNVTMKQTNSKEKAAHAGKERFIQKILRSTCQISLIDIFNGVFKLQYSKSLPGAILTSSVNTVATDSLTRYLWGKPVGRKSKEEQEKIKAKREKSFIGKWFKFMNKLAE